MLEILGRPNPSMITGVGSCEYAAASLTIENGTPQCTQMSAVYHDTAASQPTLVYAFIPESLDHISDTDEEEVVVE